MGLRSARLDDWLDEEIRRFWADHGEGPSSGLRRVAREWWVREHLPEIEFQDGPAGRRATLREGPDVWEIAMIAEELGRDPEALGQYLGGHVDGEALRQALEYWDRFPDEIDHWLAENRRLERVLRDASQ